MRRRKGLAFAVALVANEHLCDICDMREGYSMSFQEKRETMSDTDFIVPEVRTVPVPVETIVMELGARHSCST